MAVKRALYQDWKRHPVTQELFEELKQGAATVIAQMVNRDAPDLAKDQFCRAFIKVADDVVCWQPDFLLEEEEDDN